MNKIKNKRRYKKLASRAFYYLHSVNNNKYFTKSFDIDYSQFNEQDIFERDEDDEEESEYINWCSECINFPNCPHLPTEHDTPEDFNCDSFAKEVDKF